MRSMPNYFLLYSYSTLSSYPAGSTIIYNADDKENIDDDDDVKATSIWLSCTLAVVTSAVRGITSSPISPVVDVICNLYPKTPLSLARL